MPDKRAHRGAHPADKEIFAENSVSQLCRAVADYCLLLSKGYAAKSSLKLVGDKFSLTQRQRLAVMRSGCSDEQAKSRKLHQVNTKELAGCWLVIDGYNLLITIEAAMSGGFIFKGCDGCFRDLASIHGTYRKVEETIPAVQLIGEFLKETAVKSCCWLLDSPVSNSGRLKTLIGQLAEENGWEWEIKLLQSPDSELSRTEEIIATSDSAVLDRCNKWVNLAMEIIQQKLPGAKVLDLSC